MKYLLITHNDLDGAGCEISFRHHLRGHDHRAISTSNADIDPDTIKAISDPANPPDSTELFFADITPGGDLLGELVGRGYTVHRFDHHPTAATVDGLAPGSQLDTSGPESGTSLLDRFLAEQWEVTAGKRKRSESYSRFISNVRDWDTWTWAKTNDLKPKYLVNLFWLLGYRRFVELYLDRWAKDKGTDKRDVILPEHMMFVEAKLENTAKVIEATTPADVISCRFLGYQAAVTFSGNGFSVSDGSYAFLSKYRYYDLMVNINLGIRKVSVRTIKDDVSVPDIVARFGGGGHPKAGGFPITWETMTAITAMCLTGKSNI